GRARYDGRGQRATSDGSAGGGVLYVTRHGRAYRRGSRRDARSSDCALRRMSNVRCEVAGHVARVTLDRPTSMNAVDAATEQEFERIWCTIERDERVRAVVLTGAGERAFCAGADMKTPRNQTGLEYWATPRPAGFGGHALGE